MTQAENIRGYVLSSIIEPARKSGKSMAIVNAAEVHHALGYMHRFPAVCSALDSDKFLRMAKVTLINRKGPKQSSTVKWTFGL